MPHAETGLSLADFLERVGGSIKAALPGSYWVRAEILKADNRNYWSLELASYDTENKAKVRAQIWKSNAGVVDRFEQTAGIPLKAGLKILFSCSVQFHPEYGLSLTIHDIDPKFTLGDMEAKLQIIRERLSALGETELNRRLPSPRDFTHVAVVAPHLAAGLGDFRSEANELEKYGLCTFEYFHPQFQGPGMVDSIISAMTEAAKAHQRGLKFDALVMIRGGGDKAGLYELNEVRIARCVCRFPAPVMVGIGHERDSTILDELANASFGTPSLVIAHIRSVVEGNATKARNQYSTMARAAKATVALASRDIVQARGDVVRLARQDLAEARNLVRQHDQMARHSAIHAVQKARRLASNHDGTVRYTAAQQTSVCRQAATRLRSNLLSSAGRSTQVAERRVNARHAEVRDTARKKTSLSRQGAQQLQERLTSAADRTVEKARSFAAENRARLSFSASENVSLSRLLVSQNKDNMVFDARTRVQNTKYDLKDSKQRLLQSAQSLVGIAKTESTERMNGLRNHCARELASIRRQLDKHHQFMLNASRTLVDRETSKIRQAYQQVQREARHRSLEAKQLVRRLVEQVLLQNPKRVLERGFSLVRTDGNRVATKKADLVVGQKVLIEMKDGIVGASIEEITHE